MLLPGGADYRQVHAADADDNPFSIKSWRKANPGLDQMPDLLAVIKKEAARAAKDGETLASFRALRLNQGVSDVRGKLVVGPGHLEQHRAERHPEDGEVLSWN